MTSLLRRSAGAVRRHTTKALALLAFMAGIAGGAGLYFGVDGFYVRVTANQPLGIGWYPKLQLKTIPIPLTSLNPSLRRAFRESGTVDASSINGYVFRNSGDTGLCLGAKTTGPLAGENHDPVGVWNCSLALDEIWIPEQWEIDGARFTWLVNYEYQSECLDANNIGGLGAGHAVQLWDCYPADNEEWDFGDWHQSVSSGKSSYPIFVASANLCLDADKYDLRDDTTVRIWDHYPTPTQFWS